MFGLTPRFMYVAKVSFMGDKVKQEYVLLQNVSSNM